MRQRLAQLEHARREFIANASHELRTPIFSLGGFLELLDDEDLDEETRREFLATMREQVERLTKLATDLLDLSRLDAGRLRVELEPVELGEVAATLAEEFRRSPRGGPSDRGRGRRPPIALGDEERVLQIGRVLVENALGHTPPGTPVRVAGRRRPRARRIWRSRTTGPASRPSTRRTSSSASTASRATRLRQRARARDRARAGRGDGRRGRARVEAGPDGRAASSLGAAPTSAPAPEAPAAVFT